MKPESSHSVELEEFVHADEIDPMQLERSYWLGPDRESAARPFALFQKALAEEKLVGIGRIVIGTKEQLVCVRPVGDGLALTTLFYADEVTPEHEIERPEAEVADRELKVAKPARHLARHEVGPEGAPRHLPRPAARDDRAEGRGQDGRDAVRDGEEGDEAGRPARSARGEPRGGEGPRDGQGDGRDDENRPRSRARAGLPRRRPSRGCRPVPRWPTTCRGRCSRSPRASCPRATSGSSRSSGTATDRRARRATARRVLWSRGGNDVSGRTRTSPRRWRRRWASARRSIDGELCALDEDGQGELLAAPAGRGRAGAVRVRPARARRRRRCCARPLEERREALDVAARRRRRRRSASRAGSTTASACCELVRARHVEGVRREAPDEPLRARQAARQLGQGQDRAGGDVRDRRLHARAGPARGHARGARARRAGARRGSSGSATSAPG